MKSIKAHKLIALALMMLAICVCLSVVTVLHMVEEQKLDSLQAEALAELERNRGEYDDQSIVLQATSKVRAEELSAQFGADLRITEDGRYAKLTLPEGLTIRDVYGKDENRQYLEELSADYRARISDIEESGGERLPARPQFTVSDADFDQQNYLDYLNMRNVWAIRKGSGITVAVIDTGIDTDHPEFAGKISEYSYNATEDKIVKDYVLEDGSYDWSLVEDEQGHGTAVTGVIAANMNSGNVVGIAPDVTVIVIKAECDESGTFARTSDLVFGLYYAIERDVQVVNMSFGTYGGNPFAEATQLAYDSDVICVAAAGNDATSALHYPAADPNVIGVGALGDEWTLANYSNYGENSDLVAPGSTYTTLMGGRYGTMNGTSLASPIVTATVALYMQGDKYATFDDVTEVLYASCYDLGELGNDWDYGFGALDISAFLLEERGTVTFDMLTDELENEDALFIRGHALQELPEPERLYAIFDGWYYDDTFTEEVNYYADAFEGDLTLYAKWVNEDDGVPYTYVILDDGTVEIRSYTGHRRYITVPEKIEGRVVSSIGDFAFAGQERLREVGLPSGLTKIGRYAFQNCANLISIEIPEGVETIGECAFQNNTRLSAVAFLGNSKLTTVGSFAFENCGKLEKIELPASLTSIDGSAFFGATALHTINVQKGNGTFTANDGVLYTIDQSKIVAYPAVHATAYTLSEATRVVGAYSFAYAKLYTIDLANVTAIEESAFAFSALQAVMIPDSVTKLEKEAFIGCAALSSVTLGRGLTGIAENAFSYCSMLTEIDIPNAISSIDKQAFFVSGLEKVSFENDSTLKLIGESAFAGNPIHEIDIPSSVQEIGKCAFEGDPLVRVEFVADGELKRIGEGGFRKCSLLETVNLPGKLETVGNWAFAYSGLTAVTVPASVTKLGTGVFACCDALTAIEVEEGNTVYHDLNGVVYTLDNTAIHTYPSGREEDAYALESTVCTIMPWAFAGTSELGTVILPEELTVIGEYGFYLAGITRITLPEGLEEIAPYAFSKCSNLGTIHIPDNVIQVGRMAFALDWNLYSVTFNETSKLPRIGYGSFAYTGITSFTVPANVSTMGQSAFEGCEALNSITFAKNSKLESISAYLFDGCENLQSITFLPGSALTSVQAHALEGMDNLTYVDFGDAKVTNIDNFAFRFCENLSSLALPETVTNIGRYAFYGCKSLSELALPEPVEHIGSYAFLGTQELNLYFASDAIPAYLDENWDHGIRGYYVGVTDVTEDGDFKYAALTSGGVAIIEYLGSDTHVDLTTLDFGAPITAIGGSAFKDSMVTSIVLPDTLTSIQAEAFQYTDLESVSIPANVTFIGREAFAHTAMKSLTFEAGSKLSVIEQYAFEGTENLAAVTLPKSLTTMGTGVFLESGLTSVAFEEGIQLNEIPQRAFAETKLVKVALPDSVTLVNHNAFNNVTTMKSVSFGDNEGIRLMSNAFYHTGLTSLNIPANVTYIGEYCFVALPNLTTFSVDAANPNYTAVDGLLLTKSGRKLIAVPAGRTGSLTVPKSVEEIGFGAFEESKLSEILFHADANILTFGYRAFFKAENITEITIPASVVSIDYYAFAYCENLQTVTFDEGNRLKGIYEGAFLGDINLTNITIPDSIVEISDFAFYGCSKITSLPISENNAVKGIYDYAFAYTGLSGEFTTPETLIDIGNYAFLGTKLTKVTVPDTNRKQLIIGIGAFEDCNKLEEITLPFIGASYEDENISWFGYIFGAGSYEANETYVPESLKTVTITEGVTTVYTGGFAYCTGLETINVPHSVSVLWNDAFKDTTARYELTNTVMTYWMDEWTGEITLESRSEHFGKGICGNLVLSDSITELAHSAFEGCSSLTGITIPYGVTRVTDDAFYGCSSLTSVVIPDGVTSIGWDAFSGCSSLTSITIPEGVTGISCRAFENCSQLTNVTIPASVTFIDQFAFRGCNIDKVNITDIGAWCGISFPNGSEILIGASLYLNGERVTDLVIPDSVTSIGKYAFYGCNSLTNVTIPDSVTDIGYEAFYGCSSLTSITIPDGVTEIGDWAFYGCSSLASISIPDSVTSIGSSAFHDCVGLLNITIPEGVSSLGSGAFWGCSSLTSITIPESMTSIAESAFVGCDNLYEIRNNSSLQLTIGGSDNGCIPASTKVIIDKDGNKTYRDANSEFEFVDTADGFRFVKENNAYTLIAYLGDEDTVTLPETINGSAYKIEMFRAAKNVIIPESVTSIGTAAFYGCNNLTRITISDSVTSIGYRAFYGCNSLTSVVIPDSVTSIDNEAFEGCNSLTNVVIGDSVTSIGSFAFSDCTSLTSVVIPDSATSIDSYAFSDCTSLTSVVIPDSVTSIGEHAFYGCSSLTSIVIPDSVTTIGDSAFGECSNLQTLSISDSNSHFCVIDGVVYDKAVTQIVFVPTNISGAVEIPDGVTSIGSSAFSDCTSLTSVVIPDSVTSIGYRAFYGCSSLTSVVIPDSVTSIDYEAFYGCSSLTSVVIPDSVTSIGSWAFSGCSNLTSVVIPDSVTSIGSYTFYDCSSLTSVVIGDSVTSIGYEAFYGCSSLTSIVIPDSVTEIIYEAFYGCNSLTSVYITSIAAWCDISFYGVNYLLYYGADLYLNGELLRDLVIPDGVISIGNYAFYGCSSLRSVTIPDSVTSIGHYAFNGCSSLTSVVIGDGVTSIGSSAFYCCRNLMRVVIGDCVTSIDSTAFYGCNRLYEVQNCSSLELTIGSEDNGHLAYYAKLIIDKNGNEIYSDANSGAEYIVTSDGFSFLKEENQYTLIAYWGTAETITLPESINGCSYEIYQFRGAKKVIIPDGMISIGNYAFDGCNSLTSVVIPDGVISIGDYAFSGCSSLTSVVIPDSVTSIDSRAFSGCSNLTSVVIPDSVTSIGQYAFSGCNKLISISMGDSVTSIGTNAFSDTAYANEPENWSDNRLILNGWLIDVDDNVKYIPYDEIKEVVPGAYDGCQTLKNPVWSSSGISGVTNAETIIVPHLTRAYLPASLTLKNIVVLDTVEFDELRDFSYFFYNLTGVTIFVEANEKDLRWDDNFPGWNNGNRVVYGDDWIWVNFYDKDGNLIYSEPRLNSQIVRLPVYEPQADERYTYELLGWDLDGDGVVDSVPATTVVDANAYPVVNKVDRKYNVMFKDSDGTIYKQVDQTYGALIVPPADPVKDGVSFEGWLGYVEGMTVDGDVEFTAKWHTHSWTRLDVTSPTCTEQGFTTHTCRCGDSYVDSYTSAIGHIYGDWTEVTAPTCTEKGSERRDCANCDAYETREVVALGHSYGDVVTAPTCTEQGYTTHTCGNCGDSYVDSHTSEKGHTYGAWMEVTAPTCTEKGSERRDCANCDAYETRDVVATGHSYGDVVTNPTCTEQGYTTHTCANCGDSYVDTYTSATGHTYGAWMEVTASTCTEKGSERRDCANCDAYETRDVVATGHSYTDVVTAPTCTEQGYITHTCGNCGDSYVDTYTSATGHSYDAWMEVTAPTCTEKGSERRDCANCDAYETRDVVATGHSYTDVVTAPTCTEQGYTTHTCANCGDSYIDSYSNALGHSYGEWYVSLEPTVEVAGEERRDCSTCDYYETRELPALEKAGIPGDVDGNGKVNLRDAMLIQMYANRMDVELDLSVADVDASGDIKLRDAILVQQYVNHLDVELK